MIFRKWPTHKVEKIIYLYLLWIFSWWGEGISNSSCSCCLSKPAKESNWNRSVNRTEQNTEVDLFVPIGVVGGMESVNDLIQEAKLRTLWWALCIFAVSYFL